MAVNDYESSQHRGQPVELYKFIYGTEAGREYCYTNADEDVTFNDGGGDQVYTAIPISRDGIKTEGRGESNELSVEVPMTSDVAELFRAFPPGRPVSLIIRQGHIPNEDPTDPDDWLDNDFPVIWTGRCLQSNRKDNTVVLTGETSEAGMKKVGLRRHYQWACPLVLYGDRCGADKAAATVTGTIASISGNTLTMQAGWQGAKAPSNFLGGFIEWFSTDGTEYRTIIGVNGNDIKLNNSPSGLAALDTVDLVLGCPHTLTGCTDVHDNVINYGGQPFIPLKNPVNKNNHT